jgi:deazaflavin-dependent oxidoreductase (nitroreductase family)
LLRSEIDYKSRRCYDACVDLEKLLKEEYCYVTTAGRVSGKPHRIEIWFAGADLTIYLLSGGGHDSDWVKNMKKNPEVSVRIGRTQFAGTARIVAKPDEDQRARELVAGKYYKWKPGKKMNDWAETALPVAIELQEKT